MRIRYIIKNSLTLPIREYKTFLLVVLLAIICELITNMFYSIRIGQLSPLLMIINSIITLMILGVMLNLTNSAVYKKQVNYYDFSENLVEGIREYIISLFYLILSFLLSSYFIIPSGVYQNLLHINEYIIRLDINTTFMTLSELSHELPVELQLNLIHSIQINMIAGIIIFVIFSSFSFVGKIILNRSENLKKAMNPIVIHFHIKRIGYFRYIKFVSIISLIVILIFNLLYLLGFVLGDVIISAILEAFLLFFATNSFYLILTDETNHTEIAF